MLPRFRLTGANLEIFKFAVYVSFPIGIMIYVGTDTHRRLNVPNFWPDPERLNHPPKDPVEIKAELERMRQDRLEKRRRLEEKARQLEAANPGSSGVTSSSTDES